MLKGTQIVYRVGSRPSYYKEKTKEAERSQETQVGKIDRGNTWKGRGWTSGTSVLGAVGNKVKPHEYYGGMGEGVTDRHEIDKAKAWRKLKNREIEIINNDDAHRYASSEPLVRKGKTQSAVNWENLTDSMPVASTMITNRKAKVIDHFLKLRQNPKYRSKNERFVLRDGSAISNLASNGYFPEMLLLEPNVNAPPGIDLEKTPTVFADKMCLSVAAGKDHSGMAAEYFIPDEQAKSNLWVEEAPPIKRAAVLLGIHEPQHLGNLIRTATVLGCDAIILSDCIDPYSDQVLSASMAAHVTAGGYPAFHTLREEEGDDPWGIVNRMIRRHNMLPLTSATLTEDIEDSSPSHEIWHELREEDNLDTSMCFFFGSERYGLDVDYVKHNVERTCKQACVHATQLQGLSAANQAAVLLHAFSEPTFQHPLPPAEQYKEDLAKIRLVTPITREIRTEREASEELELAPVRKPTMEVSKFYKQGSFGTPAYKTRVRLS
eukprot:TRINITY_DN9201_c0_g1_i1.p1 TRINITY_DN9201_c0_g1~~TRINITY_DN9201_c0_g1_i1.p1  ORF type:complete len:491 (+),score=83.57 TRINITY_DN9201_c0_g1_i1:39-1511(+)